eukprot:scaffold48652_cov62-Phaeocystis_antarctica.AAC.5
MQPVDEVPVGRSARGWPAAPTGGGAGGALLSTRWGRIRPRRPDCRAVAPPRGHYRPAGMQVAEECDVVDVHGEDERGGPVVAAARRERRDRVAHEEPAVGQAQDRDPHVSDRVQPKPASLGFPRVEQVAHTEREHAEQPGAGRAPRNLDGGALHPVDAPEREEPTGHFHLRKGSARDAILHTDVEEGGEPRHRQPEKGERAGQRP